LGGRSFGHDRGFCEGDQPMEVMPAQRTPAEALRIGDGANQGLFGRMVSSVPVAQGDTGLTFHLESNHPV